MPSPNLAIPHVAASQNQKEVTINDAIDALDLAMTAALELDVTAGGTIAIGDSDMRRHAAVVLTGSQTSAITLHLPAVRKFLYVQNTTGQEVTVGVSGGGATVPVGAGQKLMVYATGSDVLPIEAALGATGVTPGSYGDGGNVPRITVDAQGRITSLATLPVTGGGGGGSSSGGHVSGATGTFGSGSTSAYATKGLLFVPDQSILVSHLRVYIDAASIGEDHYAQIAEVSGITGGDTVAVSATVEAPELLLQHHLKRLKLPTVLREHQKLARQCASENVDHVRYLARLIELELLDREARMIERRIKAAKFPAVKSLESFDFEVIPSLNKKRVLDLTRAEFIARHENVIALGPSGTGKTHIATAIGLAACQRGIKVRFATAAAIVNELIEARDDKRLLRMQKTLATQELLIIDELGFVPLSKIGAELLFELISQRYERGATIITSNLPFDEWTSIFGDERLTGALLDRLTHHVYILEMNGPSYRLAQSRSRQQT